MRYVFKILILGESEGAREYVTRALQDMGEYKESYNEWYKTINALDNICDLEVEVITDIFSTDLDIEETIKVSDGIIYFLNPLNIDEFELFDMYYTIIQGVQRDIPTTILYYDFTGIIPISTNDLFENIWYNYPNLEVFVNLSPIEFHQVLECLCLAMIAGDTPLNIENAWMRFPIFIELANMNFNQQNYFYAAQSLRKAADISDIYNSDEYFIRCEQTAYLFSKVNLYLEASQILEKADRKKSDDFKRIYAEKMIIEGNKMFNAKNYELAASQYEKAAQWALIELGDKELIQDTFKLGINSWISACDCEKAFRILDRLSHDEAVKVLVNVAEKIIDSTKYLVSKGKLESAKEQLKFSISIYQREGLFDDLDKFTKELQDVLIKILEQKISERDLYSTKIIYDEIDNLWDSYSLEKIDLDKILEKLIKLFIDESIFGLASIFINELNSFKLKEKLTELSIKAEEDKKVLKKKELEEYIQEGIDIIKDFRKLELNIIAEMNTKEIEKANIQIAKKNFLDAAKTIKNQSIFLKNIGHDEISDQMLTRSLDILIEASKFDDFFEYYSDLTEGMKKKYLKRVFPIFFEKLKELSEAKIYEKKERIFEISNKKFRNEMLYEESKKISGIFIKVIKAEALKIVQNEEDLSGIKKSTELVNKVIDTASSYLDQDKEILSFNKIYKKIAEIYISLEDLSSALAYSDKINKKEYKAEVQKKIEKVESLLSKERLGRIEDQIKEENLTERLSILKKKGRDSLHDRASELKQRKGLRRAYLQKALDFVEKKEFGKAINLYQDSVIRLNRNKQYNLAGVSLAFAGFLLLKDNKIRQMTNLLKEIKRELSDSGKLLLETFSGTLLEFIIDIEKLNDESKLKQAVSLLENLPLFEEEIEVVYSYLGKEYKKKGPAEEFTIGLGEIANIRGEISKISKKFTIDKQEVVKRKMMKRDYWDKPINELSTSKLMDASTHYLESYKKLAEKKLFKHAAIGLIMGSIILIKEKDFFNAQSIYEDQLRSLKSELESLPEIQMMNYVFLAFENYVQDLIKLTLEILSENLMLYEQEIEFLTILSGEEFVKKETSTIRKGSGDISNMRIRLGQIHGALSQKIGDVKSEGKELLPKRKAMKIRYYKEILALLDQKSYKKASENYFKLAEDFAKKKNYKISALIMLLYGLTSLKAKSSIDEINSKIKIYLKPLGLNKKLVKETFYMSLLLFILDVLRENLNEYKSKFPQLLEILPLFEEELRLINFNQ
jgi:hypothetical protein